MNAPKAIANTASARSSALRSFIPSNTSSRKAWPESLSGSSQEDNLALACQGCNGSKSNKTQARDPVTGRRVPLFHPRRDDWHDHFAWSSDQLRLIGLTPTGRVTIREWDLNCDGVVRLRRMLIFDQEHPPAHRSSK